LLRLLEHYNTLEYPPALVLDADALNLLAEVPEWWTHFNLHVPPILTPHPGEMARLLGTSVAHVQRDRIRIARDAARQWNAVVVLKGAFTIIAAPDERVTLLPFANPALATAGTGDVLAGTITGLAAQYSATARRANTSNALHEAYTAAVAGAFVHAYAGELAAHEIGDAGVIAGDLLPRLPEALRLIKHGI
jgi:ADP-dependent NAD(P)H-hydrate dehydratase / NAD(P)H-hydrate epimerase